MKIVKGLWARLFARRLSKPDKQLFGLFGLVLKVSGYAQMYAYSTSTNLREFLSHEWSGFREKAEELSRPYPTLRPMLGRFYIALEDLDARGRQGCLPPETYGKVLFSEANACHLAYLELRDLAEQIQKAILRSDECG